MKELSIDEKKLLLKDLCARLSYGVYVEHITTGIRGKLKGMIFNHIYNDTDSVQDINAWVKFFGDEYVDATYFRPILRPMSSMTEEERNELSHYHNGVQRTDFFYSHHIDCRFMIEKELALEASEEMYNLKEK